MLEPWMPTGTCKTILKNVPKTINSPFQKHEVTFQKHSRAPSQSRWFQQTIISLSFARIFLQWLEFRDDVETFDLKRKVQVDGAGKSWET